MATPPEDERFAAWVLQLAAHDVLSAMINGEVSQEAPTDPYGRARGGLGVCDRAAMLVTTMEPLFRGLHPELVAELRRGMECAYAGDTNRAMIHLYRAWESLAMLAGAELDLPTRRTDEPGR